MKFIFTEECTPNFAQNPNRNFYSFKLTRGILYIFLHDMSHIVKSDPFVKCLQFASIFHIQELDSDTMWILSSHYLKKLSQN